MNDNNNKKEKYSDSCGTGVLGALIFFVAAFTVMFFLSKLMGY